MSRAKATAEKTNLPPVHPIVLVHGVLGFAAIGPHGQLEYFRGVMRHLEDNPKVLKGKGKVYVADLDPADTIPSRAVQLRDFIQENIYDEQSGFRYEKVNIIAHSMGGLDARYMIANFAMDTGGRSPMADRVASLTTIGTPHLGSPVADFVLDHPVGQCVVKWANLFSITMGAFKQLSVKWLVEENFNSRMSDQPQVKYFSYAGKMGAPWVFPPLIPVAVVLGGLDGDNDGVVPVSSAVSHYRPFPGVNRQVLAADHASQIGHGYAGSPVDVQGFDHLDFYATIANALDAEGLYFP